MSDIKRYTAAELEKLPRCGRARQDDGVKWSCTNVGQIAWTWPGAPEQTTCVWCAAQAAGIAEALGFVLPARCLWLPEPTPVDPTTERARALEVDP